MSDISFPSPRFTSGPITTASSGVPATITHPPPSTAALATGSIITGTVLGKDSQGRALVKTDFGLLPLQTQAQLSEGSQVTLQVRIAGTELHVVILKVEGGKNAPQRQEGQAGGSGSPGGQDRLPPGPQSGAAANTGAGADDIASGRLIRAVVEQAASPAPARPGAGAAAQAPGGSAPAASPGAAAATASAPITPTTAAPTTAAAPPSPLAAGSEVAIRILAVTPPGAEQTAVAGPPAPTPQGATTNANAAPLGPGRLEGLVVATPPGQGARIETPVGTLRLAVQTALPPGTRLAIEVTPTVPAAGPAEAAVRPEAAAPDPALARGWPALDEALRLLQADDLALSGMTLGTHALPRPGPRFASTILFFIAALRGGELGTWLSGSAAQALERAGRGELLARLKQDFGRLSRLAAEPAPGEWRGYLVPVYDGAALGQVRFFLRRPEEDLQDDGGALPGARPEKATRFIVEVSFSRLGDLQLDGLIQGQRFDLILRSRRALATVQKQEILGIYEAAAETTGYRGQLIFQAAGEWSSVPLETLAAQDAGTVV